MNIENHWLHPPFRPQILPVRTQILANCLKKNKTKKQAQWYKCCLCSGYCISLIKNQTGEYESVQNLLLNTMLFTFLFCLETFVKEYLRQEQPYSINKNVGKI